MTLIQNLYSFLWADLKSYSWTVVSLVLYAIALFFFLSQGKKEKQVLGFQLFIGGLIMLSPIAYFVMQMIGITDANFVNIFYWISVLPVFVLFIMELCVKYTDTITRVGCVVAAVVLVMTSGKFSVDLAGIKMPNTQETYQMEAESIAECLITMDKKRILVTDELANALRQQTSEVSVVYGDDYEMPSDSELDRIITQSELYGCVAIAVSLEYDDETVIGQLSEYTSALVTEHYHIYVR